MDNTNFTVSDLSNEKIVTIRSFNDSGSEFNKLVLIVSLDGDNNFKISVDSKRTYTVCSLDDNGYSIPEFKNVKV